jgi:hypothetical protein
MALPFICTRVDELLRKAGDLGILIFDHHRDLADIEKTLRTLRIDDTGSVHTDRLIEKAFSSIRRRAFPSIWSTWFCRLRPQTGGNAHRARR